MQKNVSKSFPKTGVLVFYRFTWFDSKSMSRKLLGLGKYYAYGKNFATC